MQNSLHPQPNQCSICGASIPPHAEHLDYGFYFETDAKPTCVVHACFAHIDDLEEAMAGVQGQLSDETMVLVERTPGGHLESLFTRFGIRIFIR